MVDEGRSARAVGALASLGEFRPTPYRRVLAGWIERPSAIRVIETWAADRTPFQAVARLIPLESTIEFERDDVTEALCCALEDSGARVAGSTFHVRARLRGLKGRVETQALERAIGGFLLDRAAAAGDGARIGFADPDIIVAVEVIGKRVGYGFLDRAVRAVPVVRPR